MSLIESLERTEADSKADALNLYRGILQRNDNPEPQDGKALKRVMGILGFDSGRLRRDLAAVEQAAHLERQAATDTDELQDQVAAAGRELDEHHQAAEERARRDEEKARELLATFSDLQQRQNKARDARNRLRTLRRQNPELFGGEVDPVEPPSEFRQTVAWAAPEPDPTREELQRVVPPGGFEVDGSWYLNCDSMDEAKRRHAERLAAAGM
jgi:hypothetical protein